MTFACVSVLPNFKRIVLCFIPVFLNFQDYWYYGQDNIISF